MVQKYVFFLFTQRKGCRNRKIDAGACVFWGFLRNFSFLPLGYSLFSFDFTFFPLVFLCFYTKSFKIDQKNMLAVNHKM